MAKIIKGALLGAAIGAGAAAVQAYREDQPVEELAKNAAVWGAAGAVSGGALGWLRCRGRAKAKPAPAAMFTTATEAAREQIQRSLKQSRRQRKAAKKRAMGALHAARQQVEEVGKATRRQRKAAKRTFHQARAQAVHAALEQVDQAARSARHGAHRVADEFTSRIPA